MKLLMSKNTAVVSTFYTRRSKEIETAISESNVKHMKTSLVSIAT